MSEIREVKEAIAAMPRPQAITAVEIIDTQTLCSRLALSEPSVIKMRKQKKIPYFKVGSGIRYDWQKVIRALEEQNKKARS